ncbi:MAG: hypothetical protein JXR37_31970 [Kiritimatiellae bacterium]|nr:hypothetical protein [Kiritimatiellia bacterium]
MRLSAYSPGAICRLPPALRDAVRTHAGWRTVLWSAAVAVVLGSVAYGAVFGCWRAPRATVYAALKMPILIFAVVMASGGVNAMLAQVIGAGLSFRQTALCILLSLAIASILLGVLAPPVLFLVLQCPGPRSESAETAYCALLLLHTTVVALCGIAGTVRLYRLLVAMTHSARIAARVLLVWMFVSGLVGFELSWLLAPFLGRPDRPVTFWNLIAFEVNVFEWLWRAVLELV